jgi:hypothetical protein
VQTFFGTTCIFIYFHISHDSTYAVQCAVRATERRGRVANTPASCSRGTSFKSWLGTGAGFPEVLRFSPVNIISPSLSTLIYQLGDEQ